MDELDGIFSLLKEEKIEDAKNYAIMYFPFANTIKEKRGYTRKQMFNVFWRDHFIDRYSGEKLYNPGLLKMLNYFMPNEFPYHQHGKIEECHIIYWDLLPSIDHVIPLGRGGIDSMDNWVTTSQKRNMIKNNWKLEDIGWNLFKIENNSTWDGGTKLMLDLFENNSIDDKYINDWCKISKTTLR